MQDLFTKLRSAASRGKLKIHRYLTPSQPRLVKFPTDDDLYSSLVPKGEFLANAVEAWRNSNSTAANAALVEQFRRRREPKFFCDATFTQWAIAQSHSPWREWNQARVDRALREIDGWVNIYSRQCNVGSAERWIALENGPGNDILYPERPHRFDFAPNLALARLAGVESTAALEKILLAWCEASYDRPNTVAYLSSHLCVYRIIALAWCHAFLIAKPPTDPGLEVLLLKILLADLRHVTERIPSTTANNHLLADGFALWFGGTLYPEFGEANSWRETGQSVLLHELERQVYPDGCNFEHSSHYQEHALELVAAYVILSRLNNDDPPPWVVQRLERMLAFQCRLGGPEAVALALGDSTEDPLFPLDSELTWGTGAWRELHASLFSEYTASVDPGSPSRERAYWLLGSQISSGQQILTYPTFDAFPQGGYYVFSDGDERTRLIFRTGPKKDLPHRSGHMQADLLSVYVSVDGQKLVCESGTYTYRSNVRNWPRGTPAWRKHFLESTSSNALEIPSVDALERGSGDFPTGSSKGGIASFIEDVHAVHNPTLAAVEACTVGRNAYNGHRRGVIHVVDQYWLVYDDFSALDLPNDSVLNFQLTPGAEIHQRSPDRVDVQLGEVGLCVLSITGRSSIKVFEGETNPIAGWVSQAYGEIAQAPLLRYGLDPGIDHHCLLMWPDLGLHSDASIQSSFDSNNVLVMQFETANFTDYLALRRGSVSDNAEIEVFGFKSCCRLFWLRTHDGELAEVRFLDLRSLEAPALGLTLRAKELPVSGEVRFESGRIVSAEPLDKDLSITWRQSSEN